MADVMRNVKGITDAYAYVLCRRQRYGYGHDGHTRGYEKEVKCIPMSHGLGLAHGCLSLMHRARGFKEAQVAVAERNLLEHTDIDLSMRQFGRLLSLQP